MDSLGTHLVENMIGIARSTSSDPRWQVILSSFAHAELRKQLANKLNVTLYVSKRINQGGCKLNQNKENLIEKPEWWNAHDINYLLMSLCIPGFEESQTEHLNKFIKDLKFFAEKTAIKTVNSSEVSGSQILARLIKFKSNDSKVELDE